MTDGTETSVIATQLRDAYARHKGLTGQVSLNLGYKPNWLGHLLRYPSRRLYELEAMAKAVDSEWVLVPQDRLDEVQEIIASATGQANLATPAGVMRRLIKMMSDEVTGRVFQEIALGSPYDQASRAEQAEEDNDELDTDYTADLAAAEDEDAGVSEGEEDEPEPEFVTLPPITSTRRRRRTQV